jgi:hypothetical protein
MKTPRPLAMLNSGELAFEDDNGVQKTMSIQSLKDCLNFIVSVKVVVISACFSEKAGEAFTSVGVPHVIAIQVDSAVFKYNRRFSDYLK